MPSSHRILLTEEEHPPTASQVSAVQAIPSLQLALLGVNWQPSCGWHVSSVQATPSLHSPSTVVKVHPPAPGTALPGSHRSAVQRTPSSQVLWFTLFWHPCPGSRSPPCRGSHHCNWREPAEDATRDRVAQVVGARNAVIAGVVRRHVGTASGPVAGIDCAGDSVSAGRVIGDVLAVENFVTKSSVHGTPSIHRSSCGSKKHPPSILVGFAAPGDAASKRIAPLLPPFVSVFVAAKLKPPVSTLFL